LALAWRRLRGRGNRKHAGQDEQGELVHGESNLIPNSSSISTRGVTLSLR
jgi:hypothetical protein